MTTALDHIVIAAANLEQGVAYVRDTLGVDIPKGGQHPLMGTHNHVMRIGQDLFLEVVAINARAPAPSRPRWFGLDDPAVQYSLQAQPRLLTWVVNVAELAQTQKQTDFSFGTVTPLSRGELNWLFAVPDDGRLLAGGFIPHLMQWKTNHHPAANMADLGCRLEKLSIHHPYADWISSILADIGANDLVDVQPLQADEYACLRASIKTPEGVCVLQSSIGH